MPALLKNLVLETANAPGTGAITLNGAPAGRIPFLAAFGDGGACWYFVTDGIQAEWGAGAVHAGAPNTLTRDTVIGNSVGSGARLNFGGAVQVYNELPAERALSAGGDNGAVAVGGRALTGLVAAAAADGAPRLDQVGWEALTRTVIAATASAAVFSLPAGYSRFRVEWQAVIPTASSALYMRFSTDGGTTFMGGATDYSLDRLLSSGSSATVVSNSASYVPLSEVTGGSGFGEVAFDSTPTFLSDGFCINAAPALTRLWVAGFCTVPAGAAATNVLIGFVGTTIASGRLRLLGSRW